MAALPASTTLDERRAPLAAYLRALWNLAPALVAQSTGDANPFIEPGAVHLPRDAPAAWYRAAAAHAAAHRVYSPDAFDLRGLAPIARALLGLLEDARVECLAGRELPGLRRLWSRWHVATPQHGDGFEALMQRLARSLIDAGYADPHPWIAKGRRLFFVDEAMQVLALRQPAALRRAATLLGHDIGQMRAAFDARSYRVMPSYRDDHRWMHPPVAQAVAPADRPNDAPSRDAAGAVDAVPRPASLVTSRQAEWDWRIGRYRRDWCSLHDVPETPRDERLGAAALPAFMRQLDAHAALVRRMADAWHGVQRGRSRPVRREPGGPRLDLPAVLRQRVALHRAEAVDGRIYRRLRREGEAGSTLLLLDLSASTLRPVDGGGSLLDAMRLAAALVGRALGDAGERWALHGFRSEGRPAVQVQCVKRFDEALDPAAWRRLAGLQGGLSTRTGAALRYAAAALARRGGRRTLILLGDGRPHDVDLHDPRYLVEDARRAVAEARRQGISVGCLEFDGEHLDSARRIFGPQGAAAVGALRELPSAIARLGL